MPSQNLFILTGVGNLSIPFLTTKDLEAVKSVIKEKSYPIEFGSKSSVVYFSGRAVTNPEVITPDELMARAPDLDTYFSK